MKSGDKYGYINTEGKYVINPQFDDASSFSDDGYAVVLVGEKYEIIDSTGKMVINPIFDNFNTSIR